MLTHRTGTAFCLALCAMIVLTAFSYPPEPMRGQAVGRPDARGGDVRIEHVGSSGGGVATVALSDDGRLAYIGQGAALTVIDISQPNSPQRVGDVVTADYVHDIELAGSHAFVTVGAAGLQVFDIASPAMPRLVGSFNTPGTAYDVKVVDGKAYLADNFGGFRILDVSDVGNIRLLGHADVHGRALDLDVVGTLAYVATEGSDSLWLIDVSDPSRPQLKHPYSFGRPGTGVHIVGDIAYVTAASSGLHIFRVGSAGFSEKLSTIDLSRTTKDVFVVEGVAYITSFDNTLAMVDVGDPSNPRLLASYGTGAQSWDVRVRAGVAYLAAGVGGLQVVDVHTPDRPVLVSTYGSWFADAVYVAGHHAYVAGGRAGLQVLDVQNPANPRTVGTYATSGYAGDVQVIQDRAYIANHGIWTGTESVGGGLQIVDIHNPEQPMLLGSYALISVRAVDVVGNIAFLAAFDQGLIMLDISNPASPALLGSFAELKGIRDVRVQDGRAYLVYDYSSEGAAVVDVRNPAQPVLLDSIAADKPRGIDIGGQIMFVAAFENELEIIDAVNPADLIRLSGARTFRGANGVKVAGGLAFVAIYGGTNGGLDVIDISQPTEPKILTSYLVSAPSQDLTVSSNMVFLAGGEAGLQILRFLDRRSLAHAVYLPLVRQ
jgi:hypothetical protein